MSCIDCPYNGRCPCGYSCGNAACLTIRKQYADAMTAKSDALYNHKNRVADDKPHSGTVDWKILS